MDYTNARAAVAGTGAKAASQGLVKVRQNGWQGFLCRGYAECGLLELFSDDDFPAAGFKGKVEQKASNIGATYLVETPANGRRFYVKYFCTAGVYNALKSLFTPTGGMRSWKAAWVLFEVGVPAPEPAALLEKRFMGTRTRSVFISKAIPHAQDDNLEMYFRNNFDSEKLTREQVREKREIIKLVADVFRKAHSQDKVYFPDFHPHNMVLQKDPAGQKAIYMTDFDEVRFEVRKNDRMKNLSSLGRNADKINKRMERPAITTGDRVRFIKHYLGPENDDRESIRKLWHEILDNWELK